MPRLALHHLDFDVELEGIPPPIAAELLAYFGPARAAPSAPPLTFALAMSDAPASPTGQPAFFHGTVRGFYEADAIALTDGHSTVRVTFSDGAVRGAIHPASLSDPRKLVHVLLFIALVTLVRSRGLFHVHAGATLSPAGRGVLIVGGGGAGKTTTTLALVAAGHRFLGDDAVFLHPRVDSVAALRVARPFHVAPLTAAAFPDLSPLLSPSRDGAEKLDLDPDRAFPGSAERVLRAPGLIVLPSVDVEATCRVEPVGQDEVFDALLRSSALVVVDGMPQQPEHMAALEKLMRGADAVRVVLGRDFAADPLRIARLIDGVASGLPQP